MINEVSDGRNKNSSRAPARKGNAPGSVGYLLLLLPMLLLPMLPLPMAPEVLLPMLPAVEPSACFLVSVLLLMLPLPMVSWPMLPLLMLLEGAMVLLLIGGVVCAKAAAEPSRPRLRTAVKIIRDMVHSII